MSSFYSRQTTESEAELHLQEASLRAVVHLASTHATEHGAGCAKQLMLLSANDQNKAPPHSGLCLSALAGDWRDCGLEMLHCIAENYFLNLK